jgi:glycosyltransferase involved in cell wall biosynthesis
MTPARRILLYAMMRLSAVRCHKIVTISEFSKSQIVRYFKINASKITAIPLAGSNGAVSHQNDCGRARQSAPYIVLFSSPFAHKNVPAAIEAYRLAKSNSRIQQKLLVIGTMPSGLSIEQQPDIQVTGYISRQEMLHTLAGADLLINPSLYEGFGLPILEAMGLGVPVVCSRRASFPEVAGDAAVFFDPDSVQDMASKLALVANSDELRNELRTKGFSNERRFSWLETARMTEKVYDEVIKSHAAGL